MLAKLNLHLHDSMPIEGAIALFGCYDGTLLAEMCLASKNQKICYGIDTFNGLNDPTVDDAKNPDKNIIKKSQLLCPKIGTEANIKRFKVDENKIKLIETSDYSSINIEDPISFAFVNVYQYQPTKEVLDYLWNNLTYGGTIFIPNCDVNQQYSANLAVKRFIDAHDSEIHVSRQMLVEGIRESFIAIKVLRKKFKTREYYSFKDEPVTIALVLKTGGDTYDYNYVNNIAAAIKRNVTVKHEIVCLTDNPKGFSKDIDRVVPFANDYPKWWGKIELFRPNIFTTKRVVFFDLDTVITGNIDDIISYDGEFSALRDFYALHSMGSGVMAWKISPKIEEIYTKFRTQSHRIISTYQNEGDQKWIELNRPPIEYMQDAFPNKIVSFKRHCSTTMGTRIPENASVVCFHGFPRPHTVNDPCIKIHWNANK